MSIFDDDDLKFIEQAIKEANKFSPLELNEGNVQAIFNRCLAKPVDESTDSVLFPQAQGYTAGEAIQIRFDKKLLLQNRQTIEYLYGQLSIIHTEMHKGQKLYINDFGKSYTGKTWSQSKSSILQLLYLGCNGVAGLVNPFSKNTNNTIVAPDIKPTLSPKDSAFSAWWEAHKAEWEQ